MDMDNYKKKAGKCRYELGVENEMRERERERERDRDRDRDRERERGRERAREREISLAGCWQQLRLQQLS